VCARVNIRSSMLLYRNDTERKEGKLPLRFISRTRAKKRPGLSTGGWTVVSFKFRPLYEWQKANGVNRMGDLVGSRAGPLTKCFLCSLSGGKVGRGVKLTTHLQLVPRSKHASVHHCLLCLINNSSTTTQTASPGM
jgi:hypothetical protein